MRIGWYLSRLASERGYEEVVSGHVQIPLHSARLFQAAGHEVQIITNHFPPGFVAPACLPDGIPLHFVVDGRKRGSGRGEPSRGGHPLKLVQQALEIIRIAHRERFDVLHFCAQSATAKFAGLLRLLGLRTPVVVSLQQPQMSARPSMLSRNLWNRVDEFVVTTENGMGMCDWAGISARQVPHGIVYDPSDSEDARAAGPRNKVLFWRDPSEQNGTDICLHVYEKLAPEFPDVEFCLAVRPYWNEVPGVDDLVARHRNVSLFRFPYDDGVSVARLLAESLCVLLPFRSQSLDPQLSLMESLAAGAPVVSTDMLSIPEFITHGHNGMLIPHGDADAAVEAVRHCLEDYDRCARMGAVAQSSLRESWNWESWVDDLTQVYLSAQK